jgi:hypothetical protein
MYSNLGYFQNVFLGMSMALMFSYCRYSISVAKLIMLQIPHCMESQIIFHVTSLHVQKINKEFWEVLPTLLTLFNRKFCTKLQNSTQSVSAFIPT